MSLKAQLSALRSKAEGNLPLGTLDRLQAEATLLRSSGTLSFSLKAGDTAPEFRLRNRQGVLIRLSSLLKAGPVVVCFYRGDWCQFCALELEALSGVIAEITAFGASLVAIAPQADEPRPQCETALTPFPLLADIGAKVVRRFGLAFMPAKALYDDYKALGRPCDADWHMPLPVPATYVVDPSGQIVFSYLDSDFTNRPEPAEFLSALRRLQSSRATVSATCTASDSSPSRRRSRVCL
jgi:peroxiredoxin